MAKKKTQLLLSIMPYIGIGLLLLVLICFAGTFINATALTEENTATKVVISGFASAFKGKYSKQVDSSMYKYPLTSMSAGILISFIFVVIGIIGTLVINIVNFPRKLKDLRIALVAMFSALILIAGILILCSAKIYPKLPFQNIKLGIGAVIAGIFTIFASGLTASTILLD